MTFAPQKAIKDQALTEFIQFQRLQSYMRIFQMKLSKLIWLQAVMYDNYSSMVHREPGQKVRLSLEWGLHLSHARITSFLVHSHWRNLVQQLSWVQCFAISLHLAQQMGVRYVKSYGDSKLIINQVKGEYEVHHEDLISYHQATIQFANTFEGFYISHVSRSKIQR